MIEERAKTQLGVVAMDWKLYRLTDACSLPQNGLYKERECYEKGWRMVHMKNLFAERNIQDQEMTRVEVTDVELKKFGLNNGDILLGRRSLALDGVGQPALVGELKEPVTFESSIIRLTPKKDLVDPTFLFAVLESRCGRHQMLTFARQVAVSGIAGSDLKNYFVPIPPIREQQHISKILTTWDRAIKTLLDDIECKTELKRGFLETFVTGSKRLSRFDSEWADRKLAEVAENASHANKGKLGWDKLFGVTKAEGMVPMREQVRGVSTDRCKLVEPEWFAYNPMRLNIGSLARWKGEDEVMVSGDYVVFRCLKDQLDPRFFDHLRRTRRWEHFVANSGSGSVRVRLYFKDIGRFKFPCPPIEEQRAIADILDTCDREINLHRQQLEAIREQKRGLMQKLLTGEVRV